MTIMENLRRWFRATGRGEMEQYVIITKEEKDRVWGWPTADLVEMVKGWDSDPGELEEFFHGQGSVSFREPGGALPALQVVFHPEGVSNLLFGFVELDFDYASPLSKNWFLHVFVEVPSNLLWKMKTNQDKVAKLLDRRFSAFNKEGGRAV